MPISSLEIFEKLWSVGIMPDGFFFTLRIQYSIGGFSFVSFERPVQKGSVVDILCGKKPAT